jgi:hypothetical protein
MLSPNGKPSPRTLQTITDLTKGLFDAERGGLTNAQKIESEFRDAIENWFVDLVLTGDKAATQKLRLRLLSINH